MLKSYSCFLGLLQRLLASLGLVSEAETWPLQLGIEVWNQRIVGGDGDALRSPHAQVHNAVHTHAHPAQTCPDHTARQNKLGLLCQEACASLCIAQPGNSH